MARIKIEDLPKEQKISEDEMKEVMGGIILRTSILSPTINIKSTYQYPKDDPSTSKYPLFIISP